MTDIGSIIKRDGSVVPFDPEKITVAIYKAFASLGEHNRELAQALAGEVEIVLDQAYSADVPPTVEGIQDVVEDVLIRNGQAEAAKAFIIYRFKRGQVRSRKQGKSTAESSPVPYKILWRYFIWNAEHGVETVAKLNDIVRGGGYPQLVADSDGRYNRQIARAAEEVVENRDLIRIIIIAGPSSSGKTTTTIKLGQHLEKAGLRLKALNVDNYFFDLELHPKDEFGDYDFETPEALDLNLINGHLDRLVRGETVDTPVYSLKSGKREDRTIPFALADDEILLLDCLHGLYEPMTQSVPDEEKFKLYIETFEQMKAGNGEFVRWTDLRLLRRMMRDHLHRAYDPRKTLLHWHYVRRSELKHIVPYVSNVDFIVNSALPYELPVLKARLFDRFPAFLEEFEDAREHADAYIRARRVHELLSEVEAVEDDGCIPGDSLLREFIGGSTLAY